MMRDVEQQRGFYVKVRSWLNQVRRQRAARGLRGLGNGQLTTSGSAITSAIAMDAATAAAVASTAHQILPENYGH
jgi:hypothetical protein